MPRVYLCFSRLLAAQLQHKTEEACRRQDCCQDWLCHPGAIQPGASFFLCVLIVIIWYLTRIVTLQFVVFQRQDGDYNHLIVMLRCMKALDPDAYMEVTCAPRLSSS